MKGCSVTPYRHYNLGVAAHGPWSYPSETVYFWRRGAVLLVSINLNPRRVTFDDEDQTTQVIWTRVASKALRPFWAG